MIKWIKPKPIALVFAAFFLTHHSPAHAQLDDGIYAIFDTSIGVITAELHYVEAPMAVASFMGLAEGTRAWRDERNGKVFNTPFYDGTIVNRITSLANQPTNFDTYIVQAGTLNGSNSSLGPGYTFKDEFDPNFRHDKFGTLSMANSGKNSNASQFFFSLGPQSHLNDVHTIFGQVVGGADTLSAMARVPLTNSKPTTDVVFNRVTILRQGAAAAAFDIHAQNLPTVEAVDQEIATLTPTELNVTYTKGSNNVFELWESSNMIDWSLLGTDLINHQGSVSNSLTLPQAPALFDLYAVIMNKASYPYPLYTPPSVTNLTFTMLPDQLTISVSATGRTGTITYKGVTGNILDASNWNASPHSASYLILHDIDHPDFKVTQGLQTFDLQVLSFRFNFDNATGGTYSGTINYLPGNQTVFRLTGGDFTFQ